MSESVKVLFGVWAHARERARDGAATGTCSNSIYFLSKQTNSNIRIRKRFVRWDGGAGAGPAGGVALEEVADGVAARPQAVLLKTR